MTHLIHAPKPGPWKIIRPIGEATAQESTHWTHEPGSGVISNSQTRTGIVYQGQIGVGKALARLEAAHDPVKGGAQTIKIWLGGYENHVEHDPVPAREGDHSDAFGQRFSLLHN